jgi:sulfatase modifying factor 1
MRLPHALSVVGSGLAGLLLGACDGASEGPPPQTGPIPAQSLVADGMVAVPAGVVRLGPRKPPAGSMPNMPPPQAGGGGPAGPPPGSPGAPPGMGPGGPPPGAAPDHGAGGYERRAGGPPPVQAGVTPTDHLQMTGDPVLYKSFGGQSYEAKEVFVPAFQIDATEVTRAQYKRFLDATGYRPPFVDEDWAEDGWSWTDTDFPEGTGDHPVVLVSYYDAEEFCLWAGKRLPTEAEWQLAALGPASDERVFPWGKTYDGAKLNHGKMEEPNFDDSDGYYNTSPVGVYPSGRSVYGADDMFGNAWEFTSDARVDGWSLYSFGAEQDGRPSSPRAPGPALYVAVRGGAYFFDFRPNPYGERNEFLPELRRKTSGFRCAR